MECQLNPILVEKGDLDRTGGWWYECSECKEETFSDDCRETCGYCGATWWEGEFEGYNG